MNDLINIVGRHARLSGSGSDVEDLSRKLAALSHSILALLVENFDLVTVGEGSAISRIAVLPPHGMRNRLRKSSVRRQRIDGSQGSRVRKVGERVIIAGSWIW